MKKIFLMSLVMGAFLSLFSLSLVYAQGGGNTASTSLINGEEEQLDGVTVETPTSVPSGFGLWLRDWREKISLALTFDPLKKAEKQLLFAEERMKIAEKIIAESTNPNAQEKAKKMIEQAQKHIVQLQEKQSKWIENKDERVEKLKNNLATHELRQDEILAKIEEKLPEEAKEKFEEMRQGMLEQAKTLIGDIDDGEMSEKTAEHLIDVRERIDSSLGAVKDFSNQKQIILKDYNLSNQEIQDQLRLLWEQRKTKMEEIRMQYKIEQENLKNTLEKPDEADKIKLERIKKAQEVLQKRNEILKEYTAKIFELSKEKMSDEELQKKTAELKAELEKKMQELDAKSAEVEKLNNVFLRAIQKAEEIKDQAADYKNEVEQELENEQER